MDRRMVCALRKPKESAVGGLMRAERFNQRLRSRLTEGGGGGDTQGWSRSYTGWLNC